MSNEIPNSLLPTKVTPTEIGKQNLVTARIDLVRLFPFMSFLIMSTDYHFTNDIPTMAATTIGAGGTKVYVNEEFLNGMDRKERAFVVAHEILHIFLEHLGRCFEHNYDPQLWNIAADFCINSYLIELKEKKIAMPKIGLYDKKYIKMSADQIYHILLENADNQPQNAVDEYGTPDGEGSSGMKPFDSLQKEPMSEGTKVENRQKVAAALSQNDTDSIKQMGSGYADLIRAFEDLIESKIPWQQLLREFVIQSSKNRYTYSRPSRKSYHTGIIFPTMTGDSINLVFGVDTSGSMSVTDLTEALSELHSICEEFDNWQLDLVSCDTHANLIGSYDSEDGDDFGTIDKGLIGGGGTDMSPIVQYANEKEDPPSVCVIITDGYIPTVREIDDVPIFVIVTSAGNKELEQDDCIIVQMDDAKEA